MLASQAIYNTPEESQQYINLFVDNPFDLTLM